MTQNDKIWWDVMRAKGRTWFVFREGILCYGIQNGFWLTLLGALASAFGNGELPPARGRLLVWAFSAVCLGSFIGLALWNQHEKNYQKQKGADHTG